MSASSRPKAIEAASTTSLLRRVLRCPCYLPHRRCRTVEPASIPSAAHRTVVAPLALSSCRVVVLLVATASSRQSPCVCAALRPLLSHRLLVIPPKPETPATISTPASSRCLLADDALLLCAKPSLFIVVRRRSWKPSYAFCTVANKAEDDTQFLATP